MADNYVPQIDYTSREYSLIRSDLLSLIPTFAPAWTSRDTADFGIVLIELFSYMGDILNYYIDRSANEAFITTASQRENVLQLSRLLSYIPNQSVPSTTTLTFQNSTASPITVPAKTKIATTTVNSATSNQIVFETDASVSVPAKASGVNGSATISATQGVTVSNEKVGTSDGSSTQIYDLLDAPVITSSVVITINNVVYNRVEYLIDYNNTDAVFTTTTNADGVTSVIFGDDISGKIPPLNAEIFATYRVGGGANGNTPAGTIKYILTNAVSGLTVNNQAIDTFSGAATGGADPESTDLIRLNAVNSIRSLNRAVSLSDYARLAVQVDGVAKSNATADVYSSITIYFAPSGDSGVQVDGVTPSAVFTALSTKVTSYLVNKIPANTTVTLQPPTYVPIDVTVSITVDPKYKRTLVKTQVTSNLNTLLLFDNVFFADVISVQDIISAVTAVDGVSRVDINLLRRASDEQVFSINNKALTSYVATVTTSATHNLKVGQSVLISGVDATFNGTFIVTAVTSTTFSYALTAGNVSSVAATGTAQALAIETITCAINEIPKSNTITVNAVGGIAD